MSAQSFPRIFERRIDGWSFHIDATHAPDYIILTGIGSPDPKVFLQSVSDVITAMDEFVGAGMLFCPVVFNATHAYPKRLTVPAVMRAVPGMMRRLGRVFVVTNREHQSSDFMLTFIKAMMSMNPKITMVRSQEEALEALGMP